MTDEMKSYPTLVSKADSPSELLPTPQRMNEMTQQNCIEGGE